MSCGHKGSALIEVNATCHDCGAEYDERNAMGLAAQHHNRTGHTVYTFQTISVRFGPRKDPADAEDTAT